MPFTRPKAAQIDFDVTNISDPLIRLNSGQSGSGDKDVGIVVERGTDTNAAILWDESADEFVLVNTSEDGTTSGNVTISSYANLQAASINAAEYKIGTTGLVFEGSTADANETTLTVTDPTADRTITLPDLTGTVSLVTATETLENKTLRSPTFESGSNSPQFIETRYVNANQVEFVQVYGGGANGSYFTQGEYQKIATIIPDGNSQNYTCKVTMTATSASNFHIVTFYAALRSNTLPDLSYTITYEELYNGVKFIEPMLWTKETSTAGFILAFEYIRNANLYGNVNVDVEIIPRSSAQRANITINTTENSETTSIESGYTEQNPTLIRSINSGTPIFSQLRIGAQNELRFYDSDDSNFTGIRAPSALTGNITFTLPDGDGTNGQVLSTDGAGTLSWADGGSGGGSGSSYPNSTFQTIPGASGNFDLSYNVAQTSQETPFEASGTDAFGVNLGSVYSAMDPIGTTETLDYGDGETHVGA